MNITKKDLEDIIELLLELDDDEKCFYDHHGYCQTHYLHPKPCPYSRIHELMDKLKQYNKEN